MALPGFRDFYPDDCAFRNAIFTQWRDVAHRYGFVEYDGPPLEPLDLFTKKSGQEIAGQLYNFTDKGDREVALRPEMTPTLARLVTARHKDFKKPLKWFSIPQVFRYERQQRGRLREHYQFNCDIIGEPGLEADIELIALVIDTLRAFGLTEKDFVVRLSDRQFWTDFYKQIAPSVEKEYEFLQILDKAERKGEEATAVDLDAFQTAIGYFDQGGSLAQRVFHRLKNPSVHTWHRLDLIETGLEELNLQKYVKRDYNVVRGLAYYTGIVFEVFDRAGQFRAIAGGGRYDTLLKNLGGVDLPALGFGMGDVVLGEIIKNRPEGLSMLLGDEKPGIYVAIADEKYRPQARMLVHQLRSHPKNTGEKIRWISYPFKPLKMSKQFEAAYGGKAPSSSTCIVIVDSKILENEVRVQEFHDRIDRNVKIETLMNSIFSFPPS